MASIEKRGKRWRAKVRREGYPPISKTFGTKAEAQTWARQQESRMDTDSWQDTREAASTTLEEALGRYEREVIKRKKSPAKERSRVELWRRSRLARASLLRIRGVDVAEWRDERLEHVSGGTVRRDMALLSDLYRVARSEWGLEGLHNPCADIWCPPPGRPRVRRLEAHEERALRQTARTEVQEAYLDLALETGMRRGELLAMVWSRVDLQNRVVYVPDSKNGSSREVPLSKRAIAALRSFPRHLDGNVWPWNGEGADSMWVRWKHRAGIVGLTFHDLRHEATSRLVESGRFSLTQVAAITGHKDLRMLQVYANHRASDLARAMD